MIDITSALSTLCTTVLFGTVLVARQLRWPQLVIMLVACGASLFLVISKYFFGHRVVAPVGRNLADWLTAGGAVTAAVVCLLLLRKMRRQERARRAAPQ